MLKFCVTKGWLVLLKLLYNESLNRAAFFIALAAVEYLATTSQHISLVESLWDKFNHFFAFAVLYLLLSLGFVRLHFWQKAALLLLFGLQIEITQSFLPTRCFSMLDVVADTIGIVIGAGVFSLFRRYLPHPKTRRS